MNNFTDINLQDAVKALNLQDAVKALVLDKTTGNSLSAQADYKRYNFASDAPFEPVRCGCAGVDTKLVELAKNLQTNNAQLNCQIRQLLQEVHDIHDDVHPNTCGCAAKIEHAAKCDIAEAVEDIKNHFTEKLDSFHFDEKFSDLNAQVAAIYDRIQ